MKESVLVIFVAVATGFCFEISRDDAGNHNPYQICPKVEKYKSKTDCDPLQDRCGKSCGNAQRCCPSDNCYLSCQNTVPADVCAAPVDLMLILDRSWSINREWGKVKRFAKELTDQYDVSKDGTHVSIMTFSKGTDQIVPVRFDTYEGVQINNVNIKRDIDELEGPGDSSFNTYINKAFDEANEYFTEEKGMRSDVTKLCVLLTDGKQTDENIDPSINSQKLKDKNITVFAFGFGSEFDVDERQLETIATSPDHAGRSEDMDKLIDMVIDMTRKECPPPPTTPPPPTKIVPCPRPVDVALILDSSNSIGKPMWNDVKNYAKRIVDSFTISPRYSHVAIIRYNVEPKLVMSFKEGQQSNGDVIQRINKLEKYKYTTGNYSKGLTFIDRAFEMANSQVFTEAGGMRKDVKKVCVLMTDGQQTDFKVSYTPPHKAVKPLTDKGVEVFTLGITGDIDVDELVKTASGPDHCYSTEYFYELERKTQELSKMMCVRPA